MREKENAYTNRLLVISFIVFAYFENWFVVVKMNDTCNRQIQSEMAQVCWLLMNNLNILFILRFLQQCSMKSSRFHYSTGTTVLLLLHLKNTKSILILLTDHMKCTHILHNSINSISQTVNCRNTQPVRFSFLPHDNRFIHTDCCFVTNSAVIESAPAE